MRLKDKILSAFFIEKNQFGRYKNTNESPFSKSLRILMLLEGRSKIVRR